MDGATLAQVSARGREVGQYLIRQALQELPDLLPRMITVAINFNSGVFGTAIGTTMPAAGTPVRFFGKLMRVDLIEASQPQIIGGTATVRPYYRPVGSSSLYPMWRHGAPPRFVADVAAHDWDITAWRRYINPGDEIIARCTEGSLVQSLTLALHYRELTPALRADVTLTDGSNFQMVTGSGQQIAIQR